MDDKNFDDKSAKEWIDLIESQPISKRDEDIYPRINKWIRENKLQRILDLGCGQGVCCSKLNLGDTHYDGVDPSHILINRAKEINPDHAHKFYIGNAYNLPFSSNLFDGVFSIAVWHLLSNINKANREISNVLKNDGKFLIVTANRSYYDEWTAAYHSVEFNDPQIIGKNGDSEVLDEIYLYSESELKDNFSQNNLEVTKIENIRIWTLFEGFKK